ncbi:MAG: ComEC/Rec2 family competence protein [Ignavibacteria bacterium]|nr:ComEC/Rec2 family competence protein [Ignavibacteria bacterium]
MLIILLIIVLFLNREGKVYNNSIILFVLIILAGIAKSNFDFHHLERESVLNISRNYSNIFVTGVISDLPETTRDKIRFTLNAENLILEKDTLNISGNILVSIKPSKQIVSRDSAVLPEAGDRILLFGDLTDAPEETNPGEFNYRNYLYLNDIDKTFRVHYPDDIEIISRNNLNYIEQNIILPARKYAIANINEYIGGDEAAFLNGLVTGYRSDLSAEIKDDFVKAGVMHILAVSGLNVAYVILILSFIFSFFRVHLIPKIILYIIALTFYTYFTGATASIIRAVIMGALILIVLVVQRKINFYNITGFSAIVILAIDSKQLFNPGFILTYSSVLSIVFFMERFNHLFPGFGKRKKGIRLLLNKLFVLLLTTITAQIGVLPITVLYFSKISLIGIFANLIAIPLSNISLALGFFQIITGTFSSFLCSVIAASNKLLLMFQLWFIKECSSINYSYVEIFGITTLSIITFYFVIFILATSERTNFIPRILISITIVLCFVIYGYQDSSSLKITYLSIGNSDCAHIETPDGSQILIDAGTETPFSRSNSARVIPYLKRKQAAEISLLVITTNINKNYYCIKNLYDNFRIKKIIAVNSVDIKSKLADLIIRNQTEIETIDNTEMISGYGSLRFYFLKNKEEKSFMTKLVYGERSFLFAGNTVKDDEMNIINIYNDFLKSDVLKIAKAGSDKSTGVEFLVKVKPDLCIISTAGEKSRIFSEFVTERIKETGARIFRTDTDNAVRLICDGRNIKAEN